MFDVKRIKDGKLFTVYSVQVMPIQNMVGQSSIAGLFLIYDDEKKHWEMADSAEFEPVKQSKVSIK